MLKFQPKYYVVYSLFFFSNKDFTDGYVVWQVTEEREMGSIRAGSALNWRRARQMWPSQPVQALEDCGTSEVTIEVKMMLLLLLLSVSGPAQMSVSSQTK